MARQHETPVALTMAQFAVRQGVARSTPYTWELYSLVVRRPDGLVDVRESEARLERDRAVSRNLYRPTRRIVREWAAIDAAEADAE